jgi:hypothetical protein
VAADHAKTHHERYLAIWDFLHRENDELATAFDNPRRSAAIEQLAHICRHGLLTEDEISQFSPETRDSVQSWLDFWKQYSKTRRRVTTTTKHQ